MTLENHLFAGLSSRRHAYVDLPVDRRHADPASKERGVHRDLCFMVDIGTLALERLRRSDIDTNEEIAWLTLVVYGSVALARHPERHAVFNT